MLKRIFGLERYEATGEWRKLHNEELKAVLLTKYSSGDKKEKNEMDRACSTYGCGESAYRVLVGKLEGMRPLGTHT